MHKSKIQKHTSLENCIAKKRMFLENAKSPWFSRFEIMNEKNVFFEKQSMESLNQRKS